MGFDRILDKIENKLEEYEKEMDEDEIPPWVGSEERSEEVESDSNDTSGNMGDTFGAFDLEETASEVTINLALPGVPEDNIELTLESSDLQINVEDSENFDERTYEYELPEDAETSSIEADYVNGLLTITVQRS
jgi:HSP20 family molecular chaperone IbpA